MVRTYTLYERSKKLLVFFFVLWFVRYFLLPSRVRNWRAHIKSVGGVASWAVAEWTTSPSFKCGHFLYALGLNSCSLSLGFGGTFMLVQRCGSHRYRTGVLSFTASRWNWWDDYPIHFWKLTRVYYTSYRLVDAGESISRMSEFVQWCKFSELTSSSVYRHKSGLLKSLYCDGM